MFVLLHPLSRKKAQVEKKDWSGSSVWLEYMPVTHGVASSSLVRTAKQINKTALTTSAVLLSGAAWF